MPGISAAHGVRYAMKDTKFPHISRLFTARAFTTSGRVVMAVLVVAFAVLNGAVAGSAVSPFSRERRAILDAPYDAEPYLSYARALWNAGQTTAAERQLLLGQHAQRIPLSAISSGTDRRVLGAQTAVPDLAAAWHREDNADADLYLYWQAAVVDKPEWRDGFTTLAILAWRLGKQDEARVYIGKAFELDPNNPDILLAKAKMGF